MSAGFTLIEVAVVLAIVAVIGAIGWSTLRDYLPRFRMVGAAKGLRSDVLTLRNLAAATSRETRLRLVSSPGDCSDRQGWGGSWTLEIGDRGNRSTSWELLPPDALDDGSDDDQSEGTVDLGDGGNRRSRGVCLRQWSDLDGPGSGSEDSIVFSPRGWVTNPATDFSAQGYIEVTLVNQVAGDAGVEDEITLRVSRGGDTTLVATLGAAASTETVGTGASSTP